METYAPCFTDDSCHGTLQCLKNIRCALQQSYCEVGKYYRLCVWAEELRLSYIRRLLNKV